MLESSDWVMISLCCICAYGLRWTLPNLQTLILLRLALWTSPLGVSHQAGFDMRKKIETEHHGYLHGDSDRPSASPRLRLLVDQSRPPAQGPLAKRLSRNSDAEIEQGVHFGVECSF